MTQLSEMLLHNKAFVEGEKYVTLEAGKVPAKKMVVLTCMDARLIELLPKALNIQNGEANIVKNAGGMVEEFYGNTMKSLLTSIYELGAEEVFVIGHHDCGMLGLKGNTMVDHMVQKGLEEEMINKAKKDGIELDHWLKGFESVEDQVQKSVELVRSHPLLPEYVVVHGLAICPKTGKLDVVSDGSKA
ncbi:carbonic anhydrase [Scopulibacillus darangshiensis]|uniref:carbonic anhydrase n=1 Tax=Scopulibacillus darangshiensis TaxID=442528 RepID=A0A4R2P3M2_9BACL|nr:carbonic anhydrase [Scopulibacillus darangshiensis]TCP29303.1 carbonic anhydrase [Scopulibacillus darangshiensis]